MVEYKLGRVASFDERSRNFSVADIIPTDEPLVTRFWRHTGQVLNQGNIPACVGFSWIQWTQSEPSPLSSTIDDALQVYKTAQTLDDIPDSVGGTSVLAGAKALLQMFPDIYSSYHWAFSIDDLIRALSYIGPVVLGINWYSGMFKPDNTGTLHINGNIIGGHAILAAGVNVEQRRIALLNSWGQEWGDNGYAQISFDDMSRLLSERGEACIVTNKKNYSYGIN